MLCMWSGKELGFGLGLCEGQSRWQALVVAGHRCWLLPGTRLMVEPEPKPKPEPKPELSDTDAPWHAGDDRPWNQSRGR